MKLKLQYNYFERLKGREECVSSEGAKGVKKNQPKLKSDFFFGGSQ